MDISCVSLRYARAAAQREALSSAAAISHGKSVKGREPGLPGKRLGSGKRRGSYEGAVGAVGAVGRGPSEPPPNSQWFGMAGSDPDDGVPVSSGPFRPEREQGFGFSATATAADADADAGAMPVIRTRRRSSDVTVSVAPGPGTPRRGTLQQTKPDYGGANVTERRSTVNLSAIERAQEERRRQINGHHRMSMAGPPPPAAAAAASGHDNNRVDAAQRKAALERERLASSVAWEDDKRRARMKSVGANQAPIMRSNREAEAELRATNDHMHRIRAAASMKKFGAPPSYGAAPTFDGSAPPAAPNRYSTPGDYASATEFVVDERFDDWRPPLDLMSQKVPEGASSSSAGDDAMFDFDQTHKAYDVMRVASAEGPIYELAASAESASAGNAGDSDRTYDMGEASAETASAENAGDSDRTYDMGESDETYAMAEASTEANEGNPTYELATSAVAYDQLTDAAASADPARRDSKIYDDMAISTQDSLLPDGGQADDDDDTDVYKMANAPPDEDQNTYLMPTPSLLRHRESHAATSDVVPEVWVAADDSPERTAPGTMPRRQKSKSRAARLLSSVFKPSPKPSRHSTAGTPMSSRPVSYISPPETPTSPSPTTRSPSLSLPP